jgi:ribosomal silencing factor RsfS
MKIINLLEEGIKDEDTLSLPLKTTLDYLKKEPIEKLLFAKSETYITPFVIIAISSSPKHIDAMSTNMIKNLKATSLFNSSIRIDGNGERGWCIIDLSNCLVNLMTEEKFEKYALDDIIKGKFINLEDFS